MDQILRLQLLDAEQDITAQTVISSCSWDACSFANVDGYER